MNPQETDHLMATIRKIRDLGITVVLIEHDMKLVMNICDTITVLNYGMKLAQGTPQRDQAQPKCYRSLSWKGRRMNELLTIDDISVSYGNIKSSPGM